MTKNSGIFPHTCTDVEDVVFLLRHLCPKESQQDCSKCQLVTQLEQATAKAEELQNLVDKLNTQLSSVTPSTETATPKKSKFKKVRGDSNGK